MRALKSEGTLEEGGVGELGHYDGSRSRFFLLFFFFALCACLPRPAACCAHLCLDCRTTKLSTGLVIL
jgi:hypothetical protein